MAPRAPLPLPAHLADRPFTRVDLTTAGWSVERARRGDLVRVVHGVHRSWEAETGDWADLGFPVDPVPWPPMDAAAVVRRARGVLSHQSAALVHGLVVPAWVRPDGRLHLSRPHDRGLSGLPRVQTHARSVPPVDVTSIHGIPCTSLERTWVDLASLMPRGPVDPLVIAGDALVNHPWAGEGQARGAARTTVVSLRAALERAGRFKGVRAARLALDLVRVGADSPPETELRLALLAAGLPEPELQARIDPADPWAPAVDLAYRPWRLSLQYDGAHHRTREQQGRDARRDGLVQDAGWRSLRLTAEDRHDGFRRAVEWVRRHGSP